MIGSTIKITGVGVALSRVTDPVDLLTDTPVLGLPPVELAVRLGGRGLRYKDRATQLALCAAGDALLDAGDLDGGRVAAPAESVAVVASSNLGNLGTVCAVTSTIAQEGTRGTSPMDLPNASSNVIASSVAIRFGLRGPNLMVCNGATSGVDALFWARSLIRSGRARRVVVVGVETSDEATRRLLGADPLDVFDAAVALVLTNTNGVGAVRARLGEFAHARDLARCVDLLAVHAPARPGLWLTPERHRGCAPTAWLADAVTRDLSTVFGRASGAFGVLQCAAACAWLRAEDEAVVVITAGNQGDVVSGCIVLGAENPR